MIRTMTITTLAAGAALAAIGSPGFAQDAVVRAPAAMLQEHAKGDTETAIFAGGCFWGVQGVFDHVKGVSSTTAGYTGGVAGTATYEQVSTGSTGHAEAVRVTFDPGKVDYADLLRIYFSVVTDPTEVDRQGPDTGSQYRTALFPLNPGQARVASAYIAQLSTAHVFNRPIATKLETQHGFFPAESHHQKFMARNPNYPYIVYNDRPKVEALMALFPATWKAS